MGSEQRHGKTRKGSRANKKKMVRRILIEIQDKAIRIVFPAMIVTLDLLDDGQLNASILGAVL